MSSPGPAKGDKPGISPLRRVLGLVLLFVVVVIAWFQLSAVIGYNKAVTALDARSQDETKTLLSTAEAESLLGKSPDGPGEDVTVDNQAYSKKTYTWAGLLKSYKLTAFYTKQSDARLHHFETEGSKLPPAAEAAPAPAPPPETATTAPDEAVKKNQPAVEEGAAAAPAAPSASAPAAPDETAKKKDPEK